MVKNLRLRNLGVLAAILIIAVLTAFIDWPGSQSGWRDLPQFPGKVWFSSKIFHLGLDLQGGTHLVYKADTSEIPSENADEAVEAARDVIERRVNLFGVTEPRVEATSVGVEKRINVELAGVTNIREAIKMIGETPQLDFREADENVQQTETKLTEEEKKQIEVSEIEGKKKAEDVIKRLNSGEDFAELAKELSGDPGSAKLGGELDWFGPGAMVEPFEKAVYALSKNEITKGPVKSQFGYHIIQRLDERMNKSGEKEIKARHILIKTLTETDLRPPKDPWKLTELTGKYLKRAQVAFDPNTQEPQVSLEFNDEGAKLFEQITEKNVGKPVAIFLDGYPISAPVVQQKISGGKAVITGNFSLEEARTLARRLTAGALPVPIELIAQQSVGPSLGAVSIQKSLKAGLFGLILVALFMILFYRLPGILSVGALSIYILIVLALFKLIPVTLTLAGLAGFILSIGMAVDANVLIFERMKEELKRGKPLDLACEDGFKRAWPSIRDGNYSTLITCVLLFLLGTSSVKGFGLVLGIGVITSMFSAIVITRAFLRLFARPRFERVRVLFGVRAIKT